ncbi:MAG: hypothetical protein J1F35_08120 [Erysipelotrichales bacterium]|nr:hypothetical protein [Erysipelotrichales bacterium]
MERIIEILMERDGNSRKEAIARIKEVKRYMANCNYDPFACDSLMLDYLGLEPDYLIDILDI